MNIHEYQAKAVLRAFGVPIAGGFPAFTPDEAAEGATSKRARSRRSATGQTSSGLCDYRERPWQSGNSRSTALWKRQYL